jgi:hypothetical protein
MLRIDQMIAEIQAYLGSPMRDSQSFWEFEERRSLCELLVLLREKKAG